MAVFGERSSQPFSFQPAIASLTVVVGPHLVGNSGAGSGDASWSATMRARARSASRLLPLKVFCLCRTLPSEERPTKTRSSHVSGLPATGLMLPAMPALSSLLGFLLGFQDHNIWYPSR